MVHQIKAANLIRTVLHLGKDEIKLVKEHYGWDYEEDFYIPEEVKAYFAELKEASEKKEQEWNELFARYEKLHPDAAKQLKIAISGDFLKTGMLMFHNIDVGEDTLATRSSSGEVLNGIAKNVPQLFGGSADLSSSNKTLLKVNLISVLKTMVVVIFGSVFVNLQWVLH